MKNIKIIVATHKKYQMPEDQMYFPVQVGAEGKTKIEEYTQDNTGNNISLILFFSFIIIFPLFF